MWGYIASQLHNRIGKQCRERYFNHLMPGIRYDPWTPEEEFILFKAQKKYGNRWVKIADELPGRTENSVKNHWNALLRKKQRRELSLNTVEQDAYSSGGSGHSRDSSGGVSTLNIQMGTSSTAEFREKINETDTFLQMGSITPSELSSLLCVQLPHINPHPTSSSQEPSEKPNGDEIGHFGEQASGQ